MTSNDWRLNPDIACLGREEFTEPTILPRKDRRKYLDALVRECLSCPVIRECRMDVLMREETLWGVQGGIIGRIG